MALSTKEKKIYNLISKKTLSVSETSNIINFIKENPDFLYVQTKMNSNVKTSVLFHAAEHNIALAEKIINECEPDINKITYLQQNNYNLVHFLARNKEDYSASAILDLFDKGKILGKNIEHLIDYLNENEATPVFIALDSGNLNRAKEIIEKINQRIFKEEHLFKNKEHIINITGKMKENIFLNFYDDVKVLDFINKEISSVQDYLNNEMSSIQFLKRMFSNNIDVRKKIDYLTENTELKSLSHVYGAHAGQKSAEILSHFVKKTQCNSVELHDFIAWLTENNKNIGFKIHKEELFALFEKDENGKEEKIRKAGIIFDTFGKESFPFSIYESGELYLIDFMLDKNIVMKDNYKISYGKEVYLFNYIVSEEYDISIINKFIKKHEDVFQSENNRTLKILSETYNYNEEKEDYIPSDDKHLLSKDKNKSVILSLLKHNCNTITRNELSAYFNVSNKMKEYFPQTDDYKSKLFKNIIENLSDKSVSTITQEFNSIARFSSSEKLNPVIDFLNNNESFIVNNSQCMENLKTFLEKDNKVPDTDNLKEIMNKLEKFYLNDEMKAIAINKATLKERL